MRAEVPQIEIARYAIDLRASSHGAATFTRSFVRYEPMPDNVARPAHRLTARVIAPSGCFQPLGRALPAITDGSRAGTGRVVQRRSGRERPALAGWIASALRERRCASQCRTSSSYAGRPISSVELGLAGDEDRVDADVGLGVAGAVPVEVVAARRPSRGGRTPRC